MILKFRDKQPVIAESVFTAPNSTIIGNVEIKDGTSIWFNTVIRGDMAPIIIGARTNIQESCTLHVDHSSPLTIGSRVTVGHGAILHGATIEDNCLIGMGATILNDAQIGKNSIIGAGALISEGKKIPPGSMVLGIPGRVIRNLEADEINNITRSAEHYVQLSQEYLSQPW